MSARASRTASATRTPRTWRAGATECPPGEAAARILAYQRIQEEERNRRGERKRSHLVAERGARLRKELAALYPLPARMPKYAEVSSGDDLPLQFIDDDWDGSLLDAFRRISVSSSMVFGSVVRHAEPPNGRFGPYVFRILRMDEWDGSECDPRIDAPGQPRALVSWSGAEAGRQGVARGDVVTHVDGVPFSGTAAELAEVLKGAAARGGERQGEPLHLVFNADRAVAEVLRRRAAVLENGQGSS